MMGNKSTESLKPFAFNFPVKITINDYNSHGQVFSLFHVFLSINRRKDIVEKAHSSRIRIYNTTRHKRQLRHTGHKHIAMGEKRNKTARVFIIASKKVINKIHEPYVPFIYYII